MASVNAGRVRIVPRKIQGQPPNQAVNEDFVGTLTASAVILLTIVGTLSLGVLTSYMAITVILFAFGHRRQPEPAPAALLSRSAHAGGD